MRGSGSNPKGEGQDDGAAESQRRRATVMFADISGFTALSERLDPEEVTRVINDCFERLERIVLTHGGIVDEYLGDCVKAVFGLTPETTDATAHAVRAAIELRAAIDQYNREASLPTALAIHIGLDTGPVIAGILGGATKRDYTVMGDTVRAAAHLEDASAKGQIFVGAETREETAGEFEYRALPILELGPHGGTMQAYELVAPKPTRRTKRDSERRQVSVVFADLLGLERVSDRTDPIVFRHIIASCFDAFANAVVTHGGIVDKYTGAGIMALFGVPNAIENAPQMALNAAIQMRESLTDLNRELRLGEPLDVHIGVNSGLSIAGEIGGCLKRDYTVMGDTVNVAARLKEAAPRGAIYVGRDTHRYTRGAFEYRELEPLPLRGKAERVAAYELASGTKRLHRMAHATSQRALLSDIVGRDEELARVRQGLQALTSAGQGSVISVYGEAGIGKSRLLAEVVAGVDTNAVTLLQGRCLSIGAGLGFHPFVDLLRQFAGVRDDAPETVVSAELLRSVEELFPDRAHDIFPFIASVLKMELTGAAAERVAGIEGEALEKLIFKSIRELFETAAERRPLVFIFEDLHWADLSSIHLLETLLRVVDEHRVVFVNVFREGFTETSDHILSVVRADFAHRHVEIPLQGLDASGTLTLIRNLLKLPELPESLRKVIAERAEGNPFYIEEVVSSLVDQGAVEQVDGGYRVTSKIDSVVLPATIQDVIMARIDRLEESARYLLQVASVIGRSFYYRIIAQLLEDAEGLDSDLTALKEKQLLLEQRTQWKVLTEDSTLAEQLEYVFRHALVQDTIYSSILLKTRKQLHGRVAGTIESMFADRKPDFFGLLAHHYTRAEQWEPAQDYLFKAGEQAFRSAATSEALNFFTEASRIYTLLHGDGGDPQHRAALERNVGLALLNTGKLTDAIPRFDEALRQLGDHVSRTQGQRMRKALVDLAVLLARLYTNRLSGTLGPTDRECFQIRFDRSRAQTTSDPQNFVFDMIDGMRRLARSDPTAIEHACGMYTAAAAVFAWSGISFGVGRRFLRVASGLVKPDSPRDEFAYRMWTFILHYLEGDWSDAHVVPQPLVDHAMKHGQFWDVNTYLGLNCERCIYQGDFAAAGREIDRITELAEGYGYDFARSNQYAMAAFFALMQHRFADAATAIEKYRSDRPEKLLHLNALGLLAKCQLLSGDPAAAETLRQGEALRIELGQEAPGYHRSMLLTMQLLFDLRELEQAAGAGASRRTQIARRARGDATRLLRVVAGVARERVEAYRLVGRLWWLLGKPKKALHWWRRSIEEGKRMGARPDLARTYLELSHRLRETRDGFTAGDLNAETSLATARELFAAVGLDWQKEQAILLGSVLGGEDERIAIRSSAA